jgi:hypothetical protein
MLFVKKVLGYHHRFADYFGGGRLLLSHKHSTSPVTPCYMSYICGNTYVNVSLITLPTVMTAAVTAAMMTMVAMTVIATATAAVAVMATVMEAMATATAAVGTTATGMALATTHNNQLKRGSDCGSDEDPMEGGMGVLPLQICVGN